jgi:hypothetical protein
MSRIVSYEELEQRVRRFRPSDLLPEIAATAIRFFDKDIWSADRVRLPWALSEVAKASIVAGNEFRSAKVTQKDVYNICAFYNALDDPLGKRAEAPKPLRS